MGQQQQTVLRVNTNIPSKDIITTNVWQTGTTYNSQDLVLYSGTTYLSLKDVNLNIIPPSNISYWVAITDNVDLDLYSSIPIKIVRDYADLQDISKKNSDTALNVLLPGSKKNNKFFENFFDVDTQSFRFSAVNKVNCQVLINDEAYFVGYMKLNKINIQNSKVEYDVSLFSTVATLFADIGNFLLTDLNFDDEDYTFNHIFGLGTVTNGWYTSNFSNLFISYCT